MKDLKTGKNYAEELERYYEREAEEFIGRKLSDRFYFRRQARQIKYYGSIENELNPLL